MVVQDDRPGPDKKRFLADLIEMARKWRLDYETRLVPGEDNSWVVAEFEEELDEYYTDLLYQMMVRKIITKEEMIYIGSRVFEQHTILWLKANRQSFWGRMKSWFCLSLKKIH